MLVFAIECLQAIYMLLAGYFRLTKDLPKPVWRYQVSYISFQTYAIQVSQWPMDFQKDSIQILCRGCSRMTFQGSCFRTSWDWMASQLVQTSLEDMCWSRYMG
jgi:hypothetical protein